MEFESKFRAKFNHEVSGASFGHKISGASFGIPALNFKTIAEKFEILKFNASAANG